MVKYKTVVSEERENPIDTGLNHKRDGPAAAGSMQVEHPRYFKREFISMNGIIKITRSCTVKESVPSFNVGDTVRVSRAKIKGKP